MKLSEIFDNYYPIVLGNLPTEIEELINDFINENEVVISYSFDRDNCGVVATDFYMFCSNRGVNVDRVQGQFIIDEPLYKKRDFTPEEIDDMTNQGYDFNDFEQRKQYTISNDLYDSLRRVPHCWNEYRGTIIDFSGRQQFLNTNLVYRITRDNYEII